MDSVLHPLAEHKSAMADQLQELFAQVEAAAREGEAIHEVERSLFQRLLGLGHELLAYFFALQGDGDAGERLTVGNGVALRRSSAPHARRYVSLFGEHTLRRWVYARREGQRMEYVPLDARLQLPDSAFSYPVQDWAQRLAVQMPYRQVGEVLDCFLGLSLSVSTLERMNTRVSASVPAYWDATPATPSPDGELLVVSADGKGVPIRKPQAAPGIEAHDRQRGPKPDRKRMAMLGAVYEAMARPRTVESVWESLFRAPSRPAANDEEAAPRPGPIAKHLRGSLPELDAQGTIRQSAHEPIFAWLDEQVQQRDPNRCKPLVVIMDGQACLWEDASARLGKHPNRIEILDLLHATAKLWELVHVFHPNGSEAAHKAMQLATRSLLLGQARSLAVWFNEQAQTLPAPRRDCVQRLCGYFERHHERMRYDEYLAAGYPIASGVIEGACRHVVRDRMERSGMRWCLDGAQAMLDLRCVALNEQWDAFTAYRIAREKARLYPHADTGAPLQWPIAA